MVSQGIKTTEFWLTVFIILAGMTAAALAFVYGETAYAHVAGIIGIVTAYLKAHSYNTGRVKEKLEKIVADKVLGPCTPTPATTPPPAPPTSPPSPLPPHDLEQCVKFPVPQNPGDHIQLDIKYDYNPKKLPPKHAEIKIAPITLP